MKVYLCSVFLLVSFQLFSQVQTNLSTEDYLKLQDKTRSYFNYDIDSAFWYTNKIEASQNKIHKAFASGVKGFLFAKKREFKKAKWHYNQALKLIQSAPQVTS